ncbi:hypothetical protein J437_LFUL004260 [Ladona fulva]|uniref:MD-2-related lipid-recognition domain-containing protein n=1 Tax=Ladona fulva TaxID=123851 RepID=A0A8K0KF27_LADFU|nr:hypothetical protein J437_LFUL004260 [Ladona fulva]
MFRYALGLLLVAAVAQATEFANCDAGKPIDALRVVGCETLPCQFPRGQDIRAEMDFTADSEADFLGPKIRVKALGMWVNYPIGYDDACDGHLLAGSCPLYGGDKATFDIRIPVLSSYPKIPLDVEVTLTDKDENPLTCFFITGQVVD